MSKYYNRGMYIHLSKSSVDRNQTYFYNRLIFKEKCLHFFSFAESFSDGNFTAEIQIMLINIPLTT